MIPSQGIYLFNYLIPIMSSKSKLIFLTGLLSVPMVYVYFMRPKLVKLEKSLDAKIININEKDLQIMKEKMHKLKSNTQDPKNI